MDQINDLLWKRWLKLYDFRKKARLHPDLPWYCWNGMGSQKRACKKFVHVFSLVYFYVKTKWNTLQILQKQKFHQEIQICFPKGIRYWIFKVPQLPPNLRGWYAKNFWMRDRKEFFTAHFCLLLMLVLCVVIFCEQCFECF